MNINKIIIITSIPRNNVPKNDTSSGIFSITMIIIIINNDNNKTSWQGYLLVIFPILYNILKSIINTTADIMMAASEVFGI